MRDEAIFINGVFKSVLEEILAIQAELPHHVMYLQPYSSRAIARLRAAPPTPDDRVLLYLSTTKDFPTVQYEAEIVGWDDKTRLSGPKSNALNRVIWTLQPGETGLYDASSVEGGQSVNLLHVWRMRRLPQPFGVELLTKIVDGEPASPDRTTAGGWIYVYPRVAEREALDV